MGKPDDLKMNKVLKRGETDWSINGDDRSFLKWKDKGMVLMASLL